MAGVRLGSRDYRGGRHVERVAYHLDNQRRQKQKHQQQRVLSKTEFRTLLGNYLCKTQKGDGWRWKGGGHR